MKRGVENMILSIRFQAVITSLFLVVGISITINPYIKSSISVSTQTVEKQTIILDAGHGGLTNTID